MVEKIPQKTIEKVNKLSTNRAIYQSLVDAGYSLRQIADEYRVNPRTVWERTHDRIYSPKEKPIKLRPRKIMRIRKSRTQRRR